MTATPGIPAALDRPPRGEDGARAAGVRDDRVTAAADSGRLDESFAATWRHDLPAGIVVFLVALPLCLGISLASGAPMLSGLVTGIVGGLVVSWVSGSQLMVSGPAAGLTAIVVTALAELGSFDRFLVAVVLAGVLQIGLGVLRAGIIGYFFPSSVIRGMLSAIGLILIIKQLPYALGAGVPIVSDRTPETVGSTGAFGAIGSAIANAEPLAVVLSVASLLLLLFYDRIAPAAVRKAVPAPLVVVLLGVLGAMFAGMFSPELALPREAMVSLPTPTSLSELTGLLVFPAWSALSDPAVLRIAFTLAIVASLETLLSLEATDKLDPYKRNAPANRELFAQGIGNSLSGLIGGLPMTGVIVRSSANITAGARTRRSAFVHGVLLLLAVIAIPSVLNRIPLPALAAILLFTGYKLANPQVLMQAWKVGPKYLVPFVVTVTAILATDLLVGICVGLVVGAFFVLVDDYRNAYSYQIETTDDRHGVRIQLAEQVTFLNKARINDALHKVAPGSHLTVDASRSKHIDYDVIELLHEFRQHARARGITLEMIGVPSLSAAAAAH